MIFNSSIGQSNSKRILPRYGRQKVIPIGDGEIEREIIGGQEELVSIEGKDMIPPGKQVEEASAFEI